MITGSPVEVKGLVEGEHLRVQQVVYLSQEIVALSAEHLLKVAEVRLELVGELIAFQNRVGSLGGPATPLMVCLLDYFARLLEREICFRAGAALSS